MTWVFSTVGNICLPNSSPGGSIVVYTLAKFLTSMSGSPWTMPQWSDGTNVSTNPSALTSATQLTASKCWVRLAMPGGSGKEFIFQRSTSSDVQWRIKYTPSGGFTGGSSTGTQTPSATVQVFICGGGADDGSNPTFADCFGYPAQISNAASRFYIGADNASPSGWYVFSVSMSGGTVVPMIQWFFDPMLTGSYPTEDTDPYVLCAGFTGTNYNYNWWAGHMYQEYNRTMCKCFLGSISSSSNFVNVWTPVFVVNNAAAWYWAMPSNLGTNQFSYKDDLFRVIYARRGSHTPPTGYKGISSLFAYNAVPRGNLDTMTVSTTRDRILMGNYWMPWDGSAPLFV